MREWIKYVLQNEGVTEGIWFDMYTFIDVGRAVQMKELQEVDGLKYRIIKRTIIEEEISC